jgi:BlaI family transcriptional regulator, penicillinase repressor
MKHLTKAEEQVMQILWMLEKAFVKDIIIHLPEPKPAYNTISTIIRIMEKKGFVGYKAYGKTHEYFPLISKSEYSQKFLKGFVRDYFSNSYKQLVSSFAREENLSISEMEEMQKLISEEIQKQKQQENE